MKSTLTNKYPSYHRSGLWSYLNPTPLHSTTIISRVIAATIADHQNDRRAKGFRLVYGFTMLRAMVCAQMAVERHHQDF
jgi:hypothetical protein